MKTLLLLLILLLPLEIHTQPLEVPTKSTPLKTQLDPKQQEKDFRIWKNLIKGYVSFRQMARASLKDLSAVSDFAWAAQKQLSAIQRAAQRVQIVYDNVSNFKSNSPIQMVKDAELKIFRQTDALIYDDIPSVRESNENLAVYRDALVSRADMRIEALKNLSGAMYKGFQKKFFKTQAMSSLDDRTVKSKAPDADVQAYVVGNSVAAKGLASADVQNQALETQGAVLTGVLKNASPDGNMNPLHQAQMSKESQRNTLLMNIQVHPIMAQATQSAAWIILARAKKLEQMIDQKTALLTFAEAFSAEAVRQREIRK